MQSTLIEPPFSARSTVEREIAAKSASCCCVQPRRSLSVRSEVLRMFLYLPSFSQFAFSLLALSVQFCGVWLGIFPVSRYIQTIPGLAGNPLVFCLSTIEQCEPCSN